MSNEQMNQAARAQDLAHGGLGGLGSGQSTQAQPQNMRAEAGEGLVQSERYHSQVGRLRSILTQAGLRDSDPEKLTDGAEPSPSDLSWTVKQTHNNIRSANNQLEELINLIESQLL